MLEARSLSLRRGARCVLVDVSLELERGELVALCGPNGAGKSTLLSVLTGELRPESGDVRIDGRRIEAFSARGLARERAVMEQAPSLSAPFTVSALVRLGAAFAPRADIDEAATVSRAMALTGIAHLANHPADRLSGGERSLAHLARVLVQLWTGRAAGGGVYLLLDEPTASLDLAHQIAVMEIARAEARAGAGVLMILHDLNLAAGFADRAAIMQNGRIATAGAVPAVFDEEVLSSIYGTPLVVDRSLGGCRIMPDLGRSGHAAR